MYGTRNCNRKFPMRDKSNLPYNETAPVKNKTILQKIPLTEVTQTLRPRRGFKENVDVKNCNENKIPESNVREFITKRRANKKGSKHLISSISESIQASEKLPVKMENATNTYILENPKESILQSIENLNLKKSNSAKNSKKNSKSLQKIPLTEATITLRPRRVCTKTVDKNICKENQEPQSKFSSKPISIPKKSKPLKPKSIELSEKLVNSREIAIAIKENNKEGSLESVGNLNLENNKAGLKVNSKLNLKRPLMSLNKNEGNRAKKAKTNPVQVAQENSIMCRFPKWVFSGIESLKRGKKNARNSSVYDIEKDEDFMLEKSLCKKVVVKKAKITKIKNYATKQNRKEKNWKSCDKKFQSKKVTGKLTVKTSSKPSFLVQKTKPEAALQEKFKAATCAGKTFKNEVTEPVKASSSLTKLNTKGIKDVDKISNVTVVPNVLPTAMDDVEKSLDVHATPNKHVNCTQVEFSQINSGVESSKNLQSFPMPQQSSTPENVDRPIIPTQVFDVTMLEIQRIVPHQDDAVFSDTEYLSPEKTPSETVKSSVTEEKAVSKKGKVQNKPSWIKNLSVSLSKHKELFTNPEKTGKNFLRPKRACHQNKPITDDSSDLELSFESDLGDHEITLFESPAKKPKVDEEPQQGSPSKFLLKKLFPEEIDKSPVKIVEVEDRVLKPRLSYHSPAQFRRFISKTKKESKLVEKRKTKQDKLIDSLNEHFSELDNLELCVE